ncbi:oxidoreductase [Chitinibacter bivalviorum]|uniref:Oxidoreductase n=2 Tax=Chitinibacter bivalviorum TaxID=2739434 RepID=A0A7H9BMT2_9NEIS|nr:oxidoreductase [Chitinibacter bivalviorum]
MSHAEDLPDLSTPADDPEPQAPIEPPLEACCTSGCVPCIFDVYAEDLNAYRVAHMAWKARQAANNTPQS